ncbi:MAG: hypothetical protein WBA46_07100 [Thermomicrobiales bacterium]
MTHDPTRDDNDFPATDTDAPAASASLDARDGAQSGPQPGGRVIPIPKAPPDAESGVKAADAPLETAAEPQEADAAQHDAGARSWFSKLGIHPHETTGAAHDPAPESTHEPQNRIRFTPRVTEATPAPAPDVAPSVEAPARRVIVLRHQMPRGPLHDLAVMLGAPTTNLSARPYRLVLTGGAILIVLALLANAAGIALTLLSAIVPILLLFTIIGTRGSLLAEGSVMAAIAALGGVIVGGILGWLAARLSASNWFDDGVLNYGAAGYGGHYAHAAGGAGWLVWLVNGIVLPLVAIGIALGLPFALHRSNRFHGVADNGLHLGAATGAGFAIGTAAVFWSPLSVHDAPSFTVSDWTLMVIGIGIASPVVTVLGFAALGTAAWRYASSQEIAPAVIPAALGLGGILLLRLGSLWIQPVQEHLWLEVIWSLLIALAMVALVRITVVRPPRNA